MPRIPYNQSQILLSRKINTGFDVLFCGGEDNVAAVEAAGASSCCCVVGKAGVVCLQGPEGGDGVVGSMGISVSTNVLFLFLKGRGRRGKEGRCLQPLFISPFLLCLGAFGCVVGAGFVAEELVAWCAWGDGDLQGAGHGLVESGPVGGCGPAGVV